MKTIRVLLAFGAVINLAKLDAADPTPTVLAKIATLQASLDAAKPELDVQATVDQLLLEYNTLQAARQLTPEKLKDLNARLDAARRQMEYSPQGNLQRLQTDLQAGVQATQTGTKTAAAAANELAAKVQDAVDKGTLTPAKIQDFQDQLAAAKSQAAAAAGNTGATPSALDFFKTNGINYTNRAIVLKSDILAARAHCFDLTPGAWFHSVGILLTGSLPVNNPKATDYLSAELVQRDGAIGNLFFSFHRTKDERLGSLTAGQPEPPDSTYHKPRVDKSYFLDQQLSSDELLVYMSNGWGGRMYRSTVPSASITGTATTTPATGTATGAASPAANPDVNYYGVATGYVGLGVDGMARDMMGTKNGSLEFEVYATANYASARTLESLFSVKSAPSFYSTANAMLKLNVSDFAIALSYGTPIPRSMRAIAKDVATVSVSYTGK